MFEYPQYDDDGSENLSFENIWRDPSPQEILGTECFMPYAPIYNDENLISLKLTGLEYRRILSSIMLGSQIAYPQEWMQIYVNFLKGTHCPPVLEADECKEYPPYSAFIAYTPQNPYSQPDLIPEGYLTPPFVLVTEENIDEFPQNEIGDVIVPFGAITFDANWFEDLAGVMPTIALTVIGTGDVNIRLLNQGQGGIAIVTLDNPPNLIDILSGIITGADNIVDTNLDILSLPPETAVEHIFPVEIEVEGTHTVYIVFFPIIDDSLIPLRFGGGFRGLELCGNLEVVDMGITDIRYIYGGEPEDVFRPPYLQKLQGGVWSTIEFGADVGDFMLDGYRTGLDGFGLAYAMRNIEEEYPSYRTGDNQGFDPSPLKTYIDENSGGTPFDPSALEAAIAAAQADADAAQSTANGAVTVNNTQNSAITSIQALNTAQGISIDNLQSDMTTAQLSILIAQADILATAQRVENLDSGGAWHVIHDFTVSDQGYTADFGDYSPIAGVGWQPDTVDIFLALETVEYANQITHVQVGIETFAALTPAVKLGWEATLLGAFDWKGNGEISTAWIRVPNQSLEDYPRFRVLIDNGTFAVKWVRYLGRGENPFV